MTMINSVNAMKKTYLMMAGTVLVCTLVACNKEQEVKEETNPENEVELVTEVIRASWDEGETKGNIAEVGGAFTWSEGDKIAVHTNNDGGTWYYSQALVAGDEGQTSANFTTTFAGTRDAVAVFPNSLVTEGADALSSGLTVTLPSSYRLADVLGDKAPTPMVADNTQDILSFKHLCGLLRLTINGIPAEATKLTVDFLGRQVHGDFTIAAGNLTPGDAACIISTTTPSANDVITITNLDGSASVTVNIPLPAGTYDDVVITPYIGDDALKLMAVRHIKGGSYTASRAHRRKLTATLVSFSVSDTKKIVFAPGNLQAVFASAGSTCIWKFADNQFDTVGAGVANTSIDGPGSVSAAGTVDLFGWVGASGTNESYGILLDNGGEAYGVVTAGKYSSEALKHDWGELSIGSYASNTWRTLSANEGNTEEWNYLIVSRGGDMFAQASVNAKYGVIIFPDNYVHPTGPSSPNNVNTPVAWDKADLSVYTAGEWQVLEGAGCVFLPCTGYRVGTTVYYPDNYATYWSTTSGNRVVCFYFNNGYVQATNWQTRANASPVRLVRDL